MATNKNQERDAREARERLKLYNARQSVHTTQTKRRTRDNVIAIAAVLVVAAAATFFQISYFTTGPGAPVPAPTDTAAVGETVGDVPSPALSENRTWSGALVLNDVNLAIELDGAAAPQGVASFINDVQNGYFVGKTCHRLVDSPGAAQLIQCGSIDGVGGSDPAYSFGPVENAAPDDLYVTGTIALARQADNGDSQGHQFFITFGDSTFPSDSAGGYTVIGTVTAGLPDLVLKITSAGAQALEAGQTPPVIPTTITAATIQ